MDRYTSNQSLGIKIYIEMEANLNGNIDRFIKFSILDDDTQVKLEGNRVFTNVENEYEGLKIPRTQLFSMLGNNVTLNILCEVKTLKFSHFDKFQLFLFSDRINSRPQTPSRSFSFLYIGSR